MFFLHSEESKHHFCPNQKQLIHCEESLDTYPTWPIANNGSRMIPSNIRHKLTSNIGYMQHLWKEWFMFVLKLQYSKCENSEYQMVCHIISFKPIKYYYIFWFSSTKGRVLQVWLLASQSSSLPSAGTSMPLLWEFKYCIYSRWTNLGTGFSFMTAPVRDNLWLLEVLVGESLFLLSGPLFVQLHNEVLSSLSAITNSY